MAEPTDDADRDDRGRFKPGNKGGPGNPQIVRQAAYRNAVKNAVSPDHLKLVFQRLLRDAVKSADNEAARLLLQHTLGKPSADPFGEGVVLNVKEFNSIDDVLKTGQAILDAAVSGKVPLDQAAKLAGIVEHVRRAYETKTLAERVAAVERTLGQLDAPEVASSAPGPTPLDPDSMDPPRRRRR